MLADEVIREVAQRGGGTPDRRMVIDKLAQAGGELEILSGRSFQPARQRTSVFEPNGLPFVDVPELIIGSLDSTAAGPWASRDPVNSVPNRPASHLGDERDRG
jgi:hypothetical protein